MQNQKIRIRLKAFDYKLIDQSASEIVETAKALWRDRARSGAAADPHRAFRRAAFTAREQNVARPV